MGRLFLPLLAMLVLGGMDTASACSRAGPPPSDEELFAEASAVFIGHVFRVEEAGPTRDWSEHSLKLHLRMLKMLKPDLASTEEAAIRERYGKELPRPSVEATFHIVEVLKGQPPADGKLRSLPFVPCIGPVLAGVDYLFFLYRNNFVVVDLDQGTRPLHIWPSNDRLGEAERERRQLEKLRALSKAQQ